MSGERAEAPSVQRDDPIVIGGLGGSGTRVVARMLRALGLQLRGRLGPQLDSDWASMLIKLPRWLPLLEDQKRPVPQIVEALGVLRAMLNGAQLTSRQLVVLGGAAGESAALGYGGVEGARWWAPATAFRFVSYYLSNPPTPLGERDRWGWKFPDNHLFMPEIVEACPRARYIHVLRHPLDAAWSQNLQGVSLWGRVAGIDRATLTSAPHNAQLAWWLHGTKAAHDMGRQLGERFMLVRLERLIEDPLGTAARLAGFAGLKPTGEILQSAVDQVEPSASVGRWREHGLEPFDPQLLARAQSWIRGWEGEPAREPEPAGEVGGTAEPNLEGASAPDN